MRQLKTEENEAGGIYCLNGRDRHREEYELRQPADILSGEDVGLEGFLSQNGIGWDLSLGADKVRREQKEEDSKN